MNSELHFGVYATHGVSIREEITLPYDFQFEKCDYPVECACGHKTCLVVCGGNRERQRTKGSGMGERSGTTDDRMGAKDADDVQTRSGG